MPTSSYFSPEALEQLRGELDEALTKSNSLIKVYLSLQFTNEHAKEFAHHGFARRIGTLARCIANVFEIFPPEFNGIPSKAQRHDATINIQAAIFNVFGTIDNLAWIWVEEKQIRMPNGDVLNKKYVGLRNHNKLVVNTFSEGFRTYLANLDDWFTHLENYRHSLAHRIPLYIPPYLIPDGREDEYRELENRSQAALLAGNNDEYERLRVEQTRMRFWRPIMTHSFSEGATPVVFHPTLLTYFKTVEEIATKMKEELRL